MKPMYISYRMQIKCLKNVNIYRFKTSRHYNYSKNAYYLKSCNYFLSPWQSNLLSCLCWLFLCIFLYLKNVYIQFNVSKFQISNINRKKITNLAFSVFHYSALLIPIFHFIQNLIIILERKNPHLLKFYF